MTVIEERVVTVRYNGRVVSFTAPEHPKGRYNVRCTQAVKDELDENERLANVEILDDGTAKFVSWADGSTPTPTTTHSAANFKLAAKRVVPVRRGVENQHDVALTKKGLLEQGFFADNETVGLMQIALQIGKPPLVRGDHGCGKTVFVKAVADTLGAEFAYFDMSHATDQIAYFFGTFSPSDDGGFEYKESEFAKAYESDKLLILFLDEMTRIPDQSCNALLTALDTKVNKMYNPLSGTYLIKGDNVHIVCAANIGSEYISTIGLDPAFMDRFVPIMLTYNKQYEATVISDIICSELADVLGIAIEYGIEEQVMEFITQAAEVFYSSLSSLRNCAVQGTTDVKPSTRTLETVRSLTERGVKLSKALDTVLYGQSQTGDSTKVGVFTKQVNDIMSAVRKQVDVEIKNKQPVDVSESEEKEAEEKDNAAYVQMESGEWVALNHDEIQFTDTTGATDATVPNPNSYNRHASDVNIPVNLNSPEAMTALFL